MLTHTRRGAAALALALACTFTSLPGAAEPRLDVTNDADLAPRLEVRHRPVQRQRERWYDRQWWFAVARWQYGRAVGMAEVLSRRDTGALTLRSAGPASPAPSPRRPTTVVAGGMWDRLAACEATGDWGAATGNGFYGGLQFTLSTWRANGGTGMPNQASREQQIAVAEQVLASQGPGAWPHCSYVAGMR